MKRIIHCLVSEFSSFGIKEMTPVVTVNKLLLGNIACGVLREEKKANSNLCKFKTS